MILFALQYVNEITHKQKSSLLSCFLAVRTGLEPATPGVTGRYSNQLNYRTKYFIDVSLKFLN